VVFVPRLDFRDLYPGQFPGLKFKCHSNLLTDGFNIGFSAMLHNRHYRGWQHPKVIAHYTGDETSAELATTRGNPKTITEVILPVFKLDIITSQFAVESIGYAMISELELGGYAGVIRSRQGRYAVDGESLLSNDFGPMGSVGLYYSRPIQPTN